MKKLISFPLFIFIISLFIISQGCKEEETTQPEASNQKPKIVSMSANPATIKVNEETTVTCTATDPDGDNLTISWNALSGTFPNGNSGSLVQWKAPDNEGIYVITALASDGKAADTAVVSVTVEAAGIEPSAPILSSPENGAINVELAPSLIWNASSDATSYTLQVSTNSSFTNFIYNQSDLTGTSQQLTGLDNSITNYWRVSATNNYGASEWSDVWSFTTVSGIGGGEPCPGIETVDYEGKTYNTVLIGNQCWLKENLNVGIMINSTNSGFQQINNGLVEKYCYDNNPANCEIYGGLYEWPEAMQYSTTAGTQGICPPGWHIPTTAELEILRIEVNYDGNTLKSIGEGTGLGAGTDSSGFSALLAGRRNYNSSFSFLGYGTYFWSSTAFATVYAEYMYLFAEDSNIYLGGYTNQEFGFNIRCVQD